MPRRFLPLKSPAGHPFDTIIYDVYEPHGRQRFPVAAGADMPVTDALGSTTCDPDILHFVGLVLFLEGVIALVGWVCF